MSNADVQRRGSGRDLVGTAPGSGDLWRAAKDNPYLSLAAGPVAGWLSGWLLVSVWDTYTYAGTAAQYAVVLAVMIAFVARGARLLARGRGASSRAPRRVGPTIGGEKELLVAMRDAGGAITPVEAAMETSLSVGEAEGILSRLAERGHLRAEIRDGALCYSVPGGRSGLPTD